MSSLLMNSRFNDREPRIHKIIDRNMENDSFVQINEVAIVFEILRFSATISVKHLKNHTFLAIFVLLSVSH